MQITEGFRCESRNLLVNNPGICRQRVTNAKRVVTDEANHIPRISLVHRLAFVPEDLVRTRKSHLLLAARMMHRHVPLEFARAYPDKRNTVPMPRVHVRLDL